MKLLVILALALVAVRLLLGRWPWEPRRLPGRSHGAVTDRVQARNLLGVAGDAGRDAIIEAHRRLIVQVHPDRGGSSALVHEANAARDLLLAEINRPGIGPDAERP